MGRNPRESVGYKTVQRGAIGDDNDVSVHSVVNEYLAIDRDGNYTRYNVGPYTISDYT